MCIFGWTYFSLFRGFVIVFADIFCVRRLLILVLLNMHSKSQKKKLIRQHCKQLKLTSNCVIQWYTLVKVSKVKAEHVSHWTIILHVKKYTEHIRNGFEESGKKNDELMIICKLLWEIVILSAIFICAFCSSVRWTQKINNALLRCFTNVLSITNLCWTRLHSLSLHYDRLIFKSNQLIVHK